MLLRKNNYFARPMSIEWINFDRRSGRIGTPL